MIPINVNLSKSTAIYFLIIFAPIALVLELFYPESLLIFIFAAIGLIPLAKLIGESTEHLATHYGPTLSSLLNVTFGNAAEIIIGIAAMTAGLLDLVKASITGSIISNILLSFGLCLTVGGLKQKEQYFNKENTGIQTSMLFLAIIGLAVPTILAVNILKPTSAVTQQTEIQFISDALAYVLLGVYVASIIFTFVTHKHLFAIPSMKIAKKNDQRRTNYGEMLQSSDLHWSKKKSIILLGASVIGVVLVSEVLVNSVEVMIKQFGLSEMFVGGNSRGDSRKCCRAE